MTVLVVILTVVVALLTALVVGLLRSHAMILRRLHDLGAEASARRATPVLPVEFRMRDGLPTLPDGAAPDRVRRRRRYRRHRHRRRRRRPRHRRRPQPTLLAFLVQLVPHVRVVLGVVRRARRRAAARRDPTRHRHQGPERGEPVARRRAGARRRVAGPVERPPGAAAACPARPTSSSTSTARPAGCAARAPAPRGSRSRQPPRPGHRRPPPSPPGRRPADGNKPQSDADREAGATSTPAAARRPPGSRPAARRSTRSQLERRPHRPDLT